MAGGRSRPRRQARGGSALLPPLFFQIPWTTMRLPTEALWRSDLGARYSSDAHHSLARSKVGNSRITIRFGLHEPSSVSARPPRTTNLPPYFAIVSGTTLTYSA